MSFHKVLLPHLPTRQMRWKEPLIDYMISHVVIFENYLNIMQSKAMAKVIVNGIKECKWTEKEKNSPKGWLKA